MHVAEHYTIVAVRGVPFRSAGWVALVLLFLASLPAVTARLYASDEIEYFSYLRSLWFDHDLSFQNEYQYFYDRDIARAERFHRNRLRDAGNPYPVKNPATRHIEKPRVSGAFP